jgi:thiamine transport system permease protein
MNKTVAYAIAPGIILGAVLLGLVPLIWFALGRGGIATISIDDAILRILWFTLKQAFLSTAISVSFGLLVARAMVRREFFGRQFLLGLFAVPLALPAIVVVLTITAVYGAQGWLGGWFSIYGLNGILLAHVFFNMPLAARLFIEALNNIAPENFRLSEQLGFADRAIFKHVEWPVLRNVLPRVFGLIFLLCAASFVIVLTLGGPTATTLEVAIYQSLRQDFDVARAINLAGVQIILCLALVMLVGRMALHNPVLSTYQRNLMRRDGANAAAKLIDGFAMILAVCLIAPPLLRLVLAGIPHVSINFTAFITSILIGIFSSLLSVSLAWPLARSGGFTSQVSALAALIVPPAVLATGWFLALRNFSDSFFIMVCSMVCSIVALNALMALPFSVAALAPAFEQSTKLHDRLCAQLGVGGWARFWRIDVPMIRRPLAQALLMAFVLSLGDLTAVTLLGSQGLITLPALIHQQMGNYRGNAAGGTALVLAGFCYGLTVLAQRLGQTR